MGLQSSSGPSRKWVDYISRQSSGCWQDSVLPGPLHWGLSSLLATGPRLPTVLYLGSLHRPVGPMEGGFNWASKIARKSEQEKSHSVWLFNLGSDSPQAWLVSNLLKGRGLDMEIRRRVSLRAISETACHSLCVCVCMLWKWNSFF